MENFYSEKEIKIRELTKQGLTAKEIAEKLDSFPEAIESTRESMSLRRQGIVVWTDRNVQTLKFLVGAGESDKDIAEIMGDNKTEEAVRKKREDLGL